MGIIKKLGSKTVIINYTNYGKKLVWNVLDRISWKKELKIEFLSYQWEKMHTLTKFK